LDLLVVGPLTNLPWWIILTNQCLRCAMHFQFCEKFVNYAINCLILNVMMMPRKCVLVWYITFLNVILIYIFQTCKLLFHNESFFKKYMLPSWFQFCVPTLKFHAHLHAFNQCSMQASQGFSYFLTTLHYSPLVFGCKFTSFRFCRKRNILRTVQKLFGYIFN